MWGFFVLGPFLADSFQPFMIRVFDGVPVLGSIFAGPPSYLSLFNAALILAIMVLPFITAISVDVFRTVPPVLKEAAYGVGCTTWEVVRNVVIPYTRVGVIGGIMLALGRALGETMAVTFIIGNSFRISSSIFAPGTTISAAIASEFAESEFLVGCSKDVEDPKSTIKHLYVVRRRSHADRRRSGGGVPSYTFHWR
jgi:phosphate transport system permease protein